MLDKVVILDDVLPKKFNLEIIKHLCDFGKWSVSKDADLERIDSILQNKSSGFVYCSLDNSNEIFLNTIAKIITYKISEYLNVNLRINRFMWNMYLKQQQGYTHIDTDTRNHISIIYNLNESDGGTEIDGKFYKDTNSQAKVFNSNLSHRGVGTTLDSVRFNLNIIANYE